MPLSFSFSGNPYVFTVKTSDIDDAGTENKVTVVVYGSKGKTGKLTLGPPRSKEFSPGSKEEFEVKLSRLFYFYISCISCIRIPFCIRILNPKQEQSIIWGEKLRSLWV